MKVLYLIQSHKNPQQIYRLVQTIRKSSPSSYILVSHDFISCDLDVTSLRNLPEVEVVSGIGGRVDFSIIQGYMNAVDWLFSHNIEFDWLINLSGQDYPTQPLPQIEKLLKETEYDGFLQYFNALDDPTTMWGIKQTRERYLYQYWHSSINIPTLVKRLIHRSGLIINNAQPLIKISWLFDRLMVGVSPISPPFNENFSCYVGSYFHTLSKKCVQFLYDYSNQNTNLVNYYKKTCVPDESFIQTILVNSGFFKLCNDSKRYIDFFNNRDGHPRILTIEDYPKIIKNDIHFARKFDVAKDSRILDMLDARILQGN